jgi:hypothetical protein
VNKFALVFLSTMLPVGFAHAAQPDETATLTRHGNIEHLEVDAGRLVGNSVAELILRHRYDITYEDPRFPDPNDYVDITQQILGVPAKDERSKIHWLRNRQMSVDLDTSRGVESMLNQIIAAAAVVHPEAKFRVVKDRARYHVIPAAGSLLDTRISMPGKSYTLSEAVKAIGAAVTSASGQLMIYGCCLYAESPDEPRYRVHASDEPAREVVNRLLDGITAAGRGAVTWSILYDKKWDHFALVVVQIPDVPVFSTLP